MKNIFKILIENQARTVRFIGLLAFCVLFSSVSFGQTTAGGTQIKNQASATYGDTSDATNSYSTVSNIVTTTVANVAGMTITPDSGAHTSVVAGQQNVPFSFHLTNTGNFDDQFRFLANNQSIQVTGGSIASAFIDADSSGTFTTGDTSIVNPTTDVLSAIIHQNGAIDVVVMVNVNANASGTVSVVLGDATTGTGFDNQPANSSTHEVRTVATTSVNGLREGRGDISAAVDVDALIKLNVTYPASAVLGSDISYTWTACDTGLRAAQSITLSGAPAGSNTGIFIFAPIPVGTILKAGQTFPAGTLYTTSPLTTAPTAATWTTTAPGSLATVTRVAYNLGSTLAASACASPANPMIVNINTGDATLDIYEIGDVFANNSVASPITDQSNDNTANAGDGNANFDETPADGASDGNGYKVTTTLTRSYSVLLGPSGAPAASGPTSNNDDFTNRSVTTGIAGVEFGSNTTAGGQAVFTNTIKNTGNANDTFGLTLQSAPSGFTVFVSLDGGSTYTALTTNTINVPVNYNSSVDVKVKVVAPSGQPVMTAYPVVIRATSTNAAGQSNDTIDRLYTGALRMVKTATVINATGVGAATDPVPGAMIEYAITYTNLTSTGGTNNDGLTLKNIAIVENGATSPNNWATSTTQVVGSASDTNSGVITGDTAASTSLTDTVPTLAPGASGTFKFRRTIK